MTEPVAATEPLDEGAVPAAPTGPAVELPDAEAAAQIAAIEAVRPDQAPVRIGRAILFAFGFAVIGAAIWAALTDLTGYQLGLVAIVVGVLAGLGALKGGRGRAAQVIGALAGAFGYFLGQLLNVTVKAAQTPFSPQAAQAAMPTGPHSAIAAGAWLLHVHPVFFFIAMSAGVVASTFTSLGIVFCGIAVWEGWRLPRAR